MGYVTIKPNSEIDLYVIFSSITDSPVCWGPAEQMLKWAIKDEYSNSHNSTELFGENYYKKLEMSDEHGSSSGFTDNWDDPDASMMWMGLGTMTFANLPKALKLMEDGEEPESDRVLALTKPFEDD